MAAAYNCQLTSRTKGIAAPAFCVTCLAGALQSALQLSLSPEASYLTNSQPGALCGSNCLQALAATSKNKTLIQFHQTISTTAGFKPVFIMYQYARRPAPLASKSLQAVLVCWLPAFVPPFWPCKHVLIWELEEGANPCQQGMTFYIRGHDAEPGLYQPFEEDIKGIFGV